MGAVTDAAIAGDRRAELVAMQRRLAAIVDGPVHPRTLSILTFRLMQIRDELDLMDRNAIND